MQEEEEIADMASSLKPFVIQLAFEQFGNYALQTLILKCPEHIKNQILAILFSRVDLLLSDKYGNRVLCGLFEN